MKLWETDVIGGIFLSDTMIASSVPYQDLLYSIRSLPSGLFSQHLRTRMGELGVWSLVHCWGEHSFLTVCVVFMTTSERWVQLHRVLSLEVSFVPVFQTVLIDNQGRVSMMMMMIHSCSSNFRRLFWYPQSSCGKDTMLIIWANIVPCVAGFHLSEPPCVMVHGRWELHSSGMLASRLPVHADWYSSIHVPPSISLTIVLPAYYYWEGVVIEYSVVFFLLIYRQVLHLLG